MHLEDETVYHCTVLAKLEIHLNPSGDHLYRPEPGFFDIHLFVASNC